MKIIVNPSTGVDGITSYMNFNETPYELYDFFQISQDTGIGDFDLSSQIEQKNLIVLGWDIIMPMLSASKTFMDLVSVCQTNQLWIWGDWNGLLFMTQAHRFQRIQALDKLVPANSVKIFLDGNLALHDSFGLTNIVTETLPYSHFLYVPRITNSQTIKTQCSTDYLLTMIKQPFRPHRDVLWKELQRHEGLLQKGRVKYAEKNVAFIGSHPPIARSWLDGHPSMDLYLDSWLEVVPETIGERGWFITEKTVKPIATQTPFIMISAPGYLSYLKSKGFQTFDRLINEDYDKIQDLEQRVARAVCCLKDIISNGSEQFYQESRSILEHNLDTLFEISGRKQYELDCFVKRQLDLAMCQSKK